jgi:hypothetical protein
VPLFLAELLALRQSSKTTLMVPFALHDGGFILAGSPSPDGAILDMARNADQPARAVVSFHFEARNQPWNMAVRVLEVDSGASIAQLDDVFDPKDPAPAIERIYEFIVGCLKTLGAEGGPSVSWYRPPEPACTGKYVLALEQALAVASACSERGSGETLYGVRNIFDGFLNLCLECHSAPSTYLLLLSSLLRHRRCSTSLYREYQERIHQLLAEHTPPEPVGSLARQAAELLFNEVVSGVADD